MMLQVEVKVKADMGVCVDIRPYSPGKILIVSRTEFFYHKDVKKKESGFFFGIPIFHYYGSVIGFTALRWRYYHLSELPFLHALKTVL